MNQIIIAIVICACAAAIAYFICNTVYKIKTSELEHDTTAARQEVLFRNARSIVVRARERYYNLNDEDRNGIYVAIDRQQYEDMLNDLDRIL